MPTILPQMAIQMRLTTPQEHKMRTHSTSQEWARAMQKCRPYIHIIH